MSRPVPRFEHLCQLRLHLSQPRKHVKDLLASKLAHSAYKFLYLRFLVHKRGRLQLPRLLQQLMLLFRLVGIRFAHSASSFILSRQVQLGYHTLSVHEARVRAAGYRSFLAILLGALMLNKYAAVRIRHHLDKHKGCHDARFRLLALSKTIELRIALEEAAELNDLPDLGSENL